MDKYTSSFLDTMKKLLSPGFIFTLMVIAISVAHCSKEDVQQNLILQAMTNGQWQVQSFQENTVDVSSEFVPYLFQFYENGQVQAISGTTTVAGVWTADPNARTITSSFPTGNNTLKRLNDTWKIFNNTFSLVEANPSNTGRNAYLKLVKK
jgi:hypothetical protein